MDRDKLNKFAYGREIHRKVEDYLKGKVVEGLPSTWKEIVDLLRTVKGEFLIEPVIDDIRPDLIVINPKEKHLFIYDFKTGNLSNENIGRIVRQLRHYKKTISLLQPYRGYKVLAFVVFKDKIIELGDLERLLESSNRNPILERRKGYVKVVQPER